LALIDVIEKEGLQQNALQVGRYLKESLMALKKDYPVLGEPHGSGLLLGVDVLKPDGSPDPELAGRIMNNLRSNGVLIGVTGPHANVIKIRPPIVFNYEHAELLLGALTAALNQR
jgi:4-aminobutyrate aminotransferase-like enzyme